MRLHLRDDMIAARFGLIRCAQRVKPRGCRWQRRQQRRIGQRQIVNELAKLRLRCVGYTKTALPQKHAIHIPICDLIMRQRRTDGPCDAPADTGG
ncbi:MAG: hypothetical protein Q4G20_12225 [Paracoccus sp. (in: a-proteobacteria)]|nr:hypothetical protein [Paracoccus sp. (in: a-proteobacteria)]MDO5648690.1 hypothetical protein [Paracoccus sp. (in: a-proteobacteria)]